MLLRNRKNLRNKLIEGPKIFQEQEKNIRLLCLIGLYNHGCSIMPLTKYINKIINITSTQQSTYPIDLMYDQENISLFLNACKQISLSNKSMLWPYYFLLMS